LQVQILKRRGPTHAEPLALTAWPLGLADLVRLPSVSAELAAPDGVASVDGTRRPLEKVSAQPPAVPAHAVAVDLSMVG